MSTPLTPAMKRSALIAALRDRTLWPQDFKWNFESCYTCAIGLSVRLGLITEPDPDYFGENQFGLPNGGYPFGTRDYPGYRAYQITPEMVADRLEAIHNELKEKALDQK